MANTIQQILDQLDVSGTAGATHILASVHEDATFDSHYCVGMADAPGRGRWCKVTAAQTAAQNAADILSVLRTG